MDARRVVISLLLLCHLSLHAQFVAVDWDNVGGDSLLPVCTEVVDLPSDYAMYEYSAHIEYPEFQRISLADVRRYALVEKYGDLPSLPHVECHVGIQAKCPQLDIAFLPVVMRGGNYYRINSYKLVVDRAPVATARSLSARRAGERYASSSLLASGKWVRISVNDNGVYRITDNELKKMGFLNPDSVRLFGYGGHILPEAGIENLPDDLEEIPFWREKGYVLFHANGVVKWNYDGERFVHENNVYSNYGCYFLTEGGGVPMSFPSKTIGDVSAPTVTSYPDYAVIDNDRKSHCQYGRILVDDYDFALGRSAKYKLPISGVADGNGVIDVSFATNTSSQTKVEVSVGGALVGTLSVSAGSSGDSGSLVSKKIDVKKGVVDNMVVSLQHLAENNKVSGFLDYIRINYTRKLALRGSQTAFRGNASSEYATFEIEGCSENVRVWDLSSSVPCELRGVLSGNIYSVVAPSGVDNELIAVDVKGTFPSVNVLGNVPNQNLHATGQTDMVIIIPSNGLFKSAAERLANAHREIDGMTVAVVTAQQVYNEFSSGTPDVTAYRRFMKMLYDRAETPGEAPKYLLMFGDSWYDNRLITFPSLKQDDYLLCFESQNSINAVKSYVLEDYMGLLDDGEGDDLIRNKVDVGVGRIPATTVNDANAVVDKIILYMKNGDAGDWQNVVAVLADDGDNDMPNQHMKDAEGIASIMDADFPSYIVDRIYWDDYIAEKSATGFRYPDVTKAIKERLDKGAFVVNYSGHGSANLLSHEMVWKASDMAELKSPRLPLWVTASCDIGPFDKGDKSIAETALFNPTGGAVGLFTTTRTVLQHYNAILNKEFMKILLSPVNGADVKAVGDAVRKTKCNLIAYGKDLSENKLQYVLLGDPALRLKLPEYKVCVDRINGVETQDATLVSAGGMIVVEGRVTTRENVLANDFTGTLHATLFDCADIVKTRNNAGYGSFEYVAHNKTLFAVSDSVKEGRFTMTLPVPMDISYKNKEGMLKFFAVDSAATRSAQGHCDRFILGGTAAEGRNDGIGPEIKLYLNTPSFINGDKVNSTPCLWVELYDENGINTVGSGIGHDIIAIVDNAPEHTYNLNSLYIPIAGDYRRGTIMLPLNELEPGEHTLMLRAWDIYNNSSVATVSFVVEPGLVPEVVEFKAVSRPVVPGMSNGFVVSHNRPQSEIEVTIELFTAQGQMVMKNVERVVCDGMEYICSWDGTTSSGTPLQTGVYIARCYIRSDNGVSSPGSFKLVVINNKK